MGPTPENHEDWLRFTAFILGRDDERWVFRGQSMRRVGAGWTSFGLRPRVGRPQITGAAGYDFNDEYNLFAEFRAAGQRLHDGHGYCDLDWLALAQHHEVPTRLLDWSTDPFVAAWFAVVSGTGAGEVIAIRPPLAWSPDEPIDPFKGSGVRFARVTPRIKRVFAQRGLFSIHPRPNEDWDPASVGIQMETFEVPPRSRVFFQRQLARVGYSYQGLMDDLDGIGTDLAFRYNGR